MSPSLQIKRLTAPQSRGGHIVVVLEPGNATRDLDSMSTSSSAPREASAASGDAHSPSKTLDVQQRERHWTTVLGTTVLGSTEMDSHARHGSGTDSAATSSASNDSRGAQAARAIFAISALMTPAARGTVQRFPCNSPGCTQDFSHRSSRSRHRKNFHRKSFHPVNI